ncbi:MBL fold metallo-hydrolase [Chryseobacterium sp. Leaf180]|uniref:metal-dependent hydrolase n=1 Tax=Chryseobacterium sp. Leaf180 TaxID=1736289 RepID=UPI0006F9A876|nr:metal-dependent hydrolase [Chryseobacterium sp. Leaf180]KQR95642.1 MBL fold metallo-hydrolase [Chryseobacterium sp. Leaf180]
MKVQFLGQNCFLFTYKDKTILCDPFYKMQAAESKFDIKSQKIDYILLTHAHEDHIADVDDVLENHPEATLIGQPEICAYFKKAKNKDDVNLGGSAKVDDLKISMVPAHHTSSFPDGSYGGVPVGYVFRLPEGKNVYLAGDTGVMADMQIFPALYGDLDVSILPIGGHYTMCARKAAFAASELLKTKKVIGCHFDTFPAIAIDHEEAKNHFAVKNIELVLPKAGESFEI